MGLYWGSNPLTNLLLTSWDIQVCDWGSVLRGDHEFPKGETYDDTSKDIFRAK